MDRTLLLNSMDFSNEDAEVHSTWSSESDVLWDFALLQKLCNTQVKSLEAPFSSNADDERERRATLFLKQQSLYAIWNMVRFWCIGLFLLFASFKKQQTLENFFDSSDQCCYCMINAFENNMRMEWSVCEKKFSDNICYPYNMTTIGDNCDNSNHFSCDSSLEVITWHKSYDIYGWTAFATVTFYGIILYLVTRCYSHLGVYILFYNVLVSLGCLYWFLNMFQFHKTSENLTSNEYTNVPQHCFVDIFSLRLVRWLKIFLVVAFAFALFPLLLFTVNALSRMCNHGDRWYHMACQWFNAKLGRYGTAGYVAFGVIAGLGYIICLAKGLYLLFNEKNYQTPVHISSFVLVILLIIMSWFDIFLFGLCRCCCRHDQWFCYVESKGFAVALWTCAKDLPCCCSWCMERCFYSQSRQRDFGISLSDHK
ncbi:hypothetical protein RFI_00571 [Reticulomyxa filosa]|uniref:Uncharacterized protein n=1 Tax=Reticulomyxa filosa TaxID=46433 RepID=X6PEM5_RETFI|nr:hypothetical protein RFI_00571 [Reticulomyxa filosa]|eukprot:ETO36489.1 hypothetical protein RFI_00571 [Reticulomyxa filosa]